MSQAVETLLVEIEARGAEATLGRLESGMKRTGDAAVEMERGASQAEKGTGRLAAASARLDQALASQVRQLAAMAAAYMTVNAAIGTVKTAFDVFTGYEYQMARVKAISGATAEEYERLANESKRLGAETMFTAQQVAQAQEVLAQAGFKTSEIIAALPTLLDMSLVGMIGLAEATDYTASALRGFGIAASDAQRVADVYGRIASATNTSISDLGEGMKYVAPLAKSLGISFEEVAAALGVMADAGIKGGMAGTSLRGALSSMLKDSPGARDALRDLGLTMADIDPQAVSLGDAMMKFKEASLGASGAMSIFADRGGPAVLLMAEGAEKLKALTVEAQNAAGTGRQMASVMEDTTEGALKALASAAEGVQLAFGAGMAPAIEAAMVELTAFLRGAEGAERFGREVGAALAVLAKALMLVVENADVLKAMLGAILALKVAGWAVAGAAGVTQLVAAMSSLGPAAASGVAGLRSLSLAAGSAQLAIGAVFAALLLLNEKMKSWAEQSRAEMARIASGAADLTNRVRAMRDDAAGAIESGDATRIAEQLAAAEKVVAEKTKEHAAARERLSRALEEQARIRDANQIGWGDAGAMRELEAATERAQEAQRALNEVNIELATATKAARELAAAQAEVGLPETKKATPTESDAERKLREANEELRLQRKELLAVAEAYAVSVEAGEEAAAAMEQEIELRKLAASFTGLDTREVIANARAKADAERMAGGAAKLAALTREMEAQRRVTEAAKESVSAAKVQEKENEVLEATIAALTGAHESQRDAIAAVVRETARLVAEAEHLGRVHDLEVQVDQQWELADAYAASTAAGEAAAEAQRVENEIRSATVGLMREEAEEVAKLIRWREAGAKAAEAERSTTKIREQIAALEQLVAVRRDEFRTEKEYLEAVRQVNTEIEANRRIAEAKVDVTSEAAEEIRRLTRAESDLAKRLRENDDLLKTSAERAADFGRALQSSMPGLSNEMNDLVAGLGRVVEGLVAASEAADRFGKADGWAAAAQGIYGIAQALGVMRHNVSAGGFGGRGEGNYSGSGSAIGAVVGGIIGAYFGSPQAGVAVGSAAGGILGSFVKKGAEEALAQMIGGPNGLHTILVKMEGSLGHALMQLGVAIDEALMQVIDMLGGAIESLPSVSMKIRDGVISMTIGAVRAKFKEMDDAIGFAVSELLKQGEITGLTDTIRKVLSRTMAVDMNQLARDLEFGQWYERLGLEDAGREFLDAMASFRVNLRKATQFGLDLAPIYAELTRNLAGIRRQILGISETEEERIRRQAESYNAQVELFRAEQLIRQSELLLKRAELEAETQALRAKMGIVEGDADVLRAQVAVSRERVRLQQAEAEAGLAMLEVQGAIVNAEGQMLGAMIAQLRAIDDALAAIDLILPSLVLISEEEIAAAIARAAGSISSGYAGGGDDGARALESFLATLEQIEMAAMPQFEQRLLELQKRFEELAKQAEELGQGEERVAAAREVAIRQLMTQMIDPIRQFVSPTIGGTFGMTDPQARAAEINRLFREVWDANEKLWEEEGKRAISQTELLAAQRRAIEALTDDVIRGLGLPLEEARDRVRALREAVEWLRSAESGLAKDADRFARVMDQLMRQSEATLLGLGAELLEVMGRGEEAAELRRQVEEMEFALKVAEFQFLYQQYLALGLLSEEVAARLAEVLEYVSDPRNWPDFSSPNYGYGGGGYQPPPQQGESEWERVKREMKELAAQWNELQFSPLEREARALRKTYEDLRAEAVRWRLSVAEFDAAWAIARQNFVDEALAPYRHLGESNEQRQLRELTERFEEIRASFEAIGATAEQMADLEEARQAAIADFWRQVTANARAFLEELRGSDPRVDTRTRLGDLRQQFNEAVAAARAGDPAAVARVVELGRQLRDAGAAFYGTASGAYGNLIDEITRALESLPGMDVDVSRQQLNVSQQQLDIQRRMLIALGGSDEGLGLPPQGAWRSEALLSPTRLGRNAAADSAERERAADARVAALEEEIAAERERSRRMAEAISDLTREIGRLASSVDLAADNARRSGGGRVNP